MEIRPLGVADLDQLADIDAAMEVTRYLHVEQTGEGLNVGWKVSERAMREAGVAANRMGEDAAFRARQIAMGHDEGLAVVTELRGGVVALAVAVPEAGRGGEKGVLRVVDLRVDFDVRREGMGTALMYQVLQHAREKEMRAVVAETRSDNVVGAMFLVKLGFKLAGLDTQRESNHDLVKEQATLVWYAGVE